MGTVSKGLGPVHLMMLALGMVIGGSFFLGSAIAIRAAGPAIVAAFALGGVLVYLILAALSELTVADPAPGSFRGYAHRAFGPYAGFLVGWMYWGALILAMSSEAIAAAVFLRGWIPVLQAPELAALVVVAVTSLNLLGARLFSRLESGLAAIKVAAVLGFIVAGAALVVGFVPGRAAVGAGVLMAERLAPGGLSGIAGSMLIVIFTYAGFEVIGLAATDAAVPERTIPRAILYTVGALVGLYMLTMIVILPLLPTAVMSEKTSPLADALAAHGLMSLAGAMNIILVSAILSTMLAAIFGLGRMLRALAIEGQAPRWLVGGDRHGVPIRAILASGVGMLAGLAMGYVLPERIYLFLVSSSGFALLFTYLVILVAHYRLRQVQGCPNNGCQLPFYPYSSWLGVAGLIAIIASMPLIPGQGDGLIAGLVLIAVISGSYALTRKKLPRPAAQLSPAPLLKPETNTGPEGAGKKPVKNRENKDG